MTDPMSGSRSERLDRAIHALLSQTPEIEAASVVSFDGLPMAAALPPTMDEDRVAAMSAALLSLGERAAEGLGRGELSQVYIEGDNGTVFLISADDEAVLVAVASKGAKVGMMLFELKRVAAVIAEVLRSDDAPFVPEHVPAQAAPTHEGRLAALEPAAPEPAALEPAGLRAVPTYAAAEPAAVEEPAPTYASVPGYESRSSYAAPSYVPPSSSAAPSSPAPSSPASASPSYEPVPSYTAAASEPAYVPSALDEPMAVVADPPGWAPTYAPSGSLPPATWS